MRFRVLGAFGGDTPDCKMTSFLINEVIVLDAGSTCRALSVPEQRLVRHVVVSHSHIDHTVSLPFLVENTFGSYEEPLSIYANPETLSGIHRHVFNDDTWPDFTKIPFGQLPSVAFNEIQAEEPVVINGVEFTAIDVNHVIRTSGFLIRADGASVLYTADTGPTERVWEIANQTEDLAAVIVECSFPNEFQGLADISLHFTPQSLRAELEKLKVDVPVYLFHLKPPHVAKLRREIAATEYTHRVLELEQDRTYLFGENTEEE